MLLVSYWSVGNLRELQPKDCDTESKSRHYALIRVDLPGHNKQLLGWGSDHMGWLSSQSKEPKIVTI